MASMRLARASSKVAPWVLAPGNSSTNPMYPCGTFLNTAVNCTCILNPHESSSDPIIDVAAPILKSILMEAPAVNSPGGLRALDLLPEPLGELFDALAGGGGDGDDGLTQPIAQVLHPAAVGVEV